MKLHRSVFAAMAIVGCVALSVVALSAWPTESSPVPAPTQLESAVTEPSVTSETPETSFDAADELSAAFASVAEAIQPSVVSVSAVRRIEGTRMQRLPAPFFDSPFRDFFGDDFFDRFFSPRDPDDGWAQQGLGSGVVVTSEGHILTNHHVVRDADEVTVRQGDETWAAEVVGTDSMTDLAVLHVDALELPAARLGDSERVRVGEWVVAVGDPFGLSSSITAGIVSATGRSRVGVADYEDFIQTDAAINPGNSGGPLVNLRGEVIGINTAILSRSGGYMGIGLAIPVSMARSVMESLIDEGRVVRGWLGVTVQDLTPGLARSFGYESADGALVSEVVEDGAADEAGLQPGDIITAYDGEPLEDMDDLRLMVAGTRPDTVVSLEVFRDGDRRELSVQVGQREGENAAAGATRATSPDADLGLTVRELTAESARELGLERSQRGVVVAGVEPLSPAARAGLQAGDVITGVQGEEIRDVADFREALGRHDLQEGVRLTVRGREGQRFVFLRAG